MYIGDKNIFYFCFWFAMSIQLQWSAVQSQCFMYDMKVVAQKIILFPSTAFALIENLKPICLFKSFYSPHQLHSI